MWFTACEVDGIFFADLICRDWVEGIRRVAFAGKVGARREEGGCVVHRRVADGGVQGAAQGIGVGELHVGVQKGAEEEEEEEEGEDICGEGVGHGCGKL